MATKQDVLDAFAYYIGNGGYYEKASAKNLSREVSDFAANKGSGNYTYMGKLCGINPGAWCAMMVTTAVYEACGNDKAAAKSAMWGVYPYTACNQLFDAGLNNGASHYSYYQRVIKGKGGVSYIPQAGDVIVFSDNGRTRSHTGMVYAADADTVYTYEGNSGNMARKRSYSRASSYIYGYVTLNLKDGEETNPGIRKFQSWLGVEADGLYGPITKKAVIQKHQKYLNEELGADIEEDGIWGEETYYATEKVQKGDKSDDVTLWQGLLYCLDFDPVYLDGEFGDKTEAAARLLQVKLGLNATGIADRYTWAKALGKTRPAHTELSLGDRGAEVKYLQRLLVENGYPLETDGGFGYKTEAALAEYQEEAGVEERKVCGEETWKAIE